VKRCSVLVSASFAFIHVPTWAPGALLRIYDHSLGVHRSGFTSPLKGPVARWSVVPLVQCILQSRSQNFVNWPLSSSGHRI
jgi:hypothetical protein